MSKEFTTTATFQKGARVVNDYKHDMIFEQPKRRISTTRIYSYENVPAGMKRTTVTRKFTH